MPEQLKIEKNMDDRLECGKCGRRFKMESIYYTHYDRCNGSVRRYK